MTQRRNYFIEKPMQAKFILTLILLLFLVAVITLCNVYVILEYVRTNSGIEVADSSMQVVWQLMGPRLVLIGVVNIIIVAIIGVFYSHQFAGPSFKLERSIRQIGQGDLASRVTLRQNDALQGVADAINEMLDRLRQLVGRGNELTQQIKASSSKIPSDDENVARGVGTLKAVAGELEDLLAGWRVGTAAPPGDEKAPDRSEEVSA